METLTASLTWAGLRDSSGCSNGNEEEDEDDSVNGSGEGRVEEDDDSLMFLGVFVGDDRGGALEIVLVEPS